MTPIRRLYLYSMALFGLLTALMGFTLIAYQLILSGFASGSVRGAVQGLLHSPEAPWLGVGPAALLLWLVHWLIADRAAAPNTLSGAEERQSPERKSFLYAGQLASLGTAVIQAGLLLLEFWRRALGVPTSASAGWYAWPAAHLLGAGLAAMAWGWLRWIALADGDFGVEGRPARSIRRAYVYTVALCASVSVIAGSILGVETVVSGVLAAATTDRDWRITLATWCAVATVGVPLAMLAWRRADEIAITSPAAELRAAGRVFAVHLLQGIGTALTLVGVTALVMTLVGRLLGAGTDPIGIPPSLLLGAVPAGLATWVCFARRSRRDYTVDAASPEMASARRTARYFWSACALAALSVGLIQLIGLIARAVSPTEASPAISDPWARFSVAATLVLVATPVWWGHWWPQQSRSRRNDRVGERERSALSRSIYLYLIAGLAAALLLGALIRAGVLLILWWSRVNSAGFPLSGLVVAGSVALLGAILSIAHWMTIREDTRLRLQDVRSSAPARLAAQSEQATTTQPASQASEPISEAPAASPRARQFERQALPSPDGIASGSLRNALTPPTICVVDGLDGAWGAELVGAISVAMPAATVWAIGLSETARLAMVTRSGSENAPDVPDDALEHATIIVGPCDMLQPNGLGGEVTEELARRLSGLQTRLLLLPPRDGRLRWIGAPDWTLQEWVENAVVELENSLQSGPLASEAG